MAYNFCRLPPSLHFDNFSGQQPFLLTVVATDTQRASWVEAQRGGQEFTGTRGHADTLASSVGGSLRPPLGDRSVAVIHQYAVVILQLLQETNEESGARIILAALHPQRCAEGREFLRHLAMIDVDPETQNHGMDTVHIRAHFRQDATNLLAVDQQVVGPADIRR